MIEILVVRCPDMGDDVTVWEDGVDITSDDDRCTVIVVDAGAGYEYADWRDSADGVLARVLSDACLRAATAAYADPPGKQYIDNWPKEDL